MLSEWLLGWDYLNHHFFPSCFLSKLWTKSFSKLYRDYDVVDYRDIISVDNVISKTVRDYKNEKWLNVLDDEGEVVKVLNNKEHLINLSDLIRIKQEFYQ